MLNASQIGKLTRYNVSYIFSIFIAIANLAFIYAVLPESLKQQDGARSVAPQPSVFKSVFSPISVFFRSAGSPKSIPLLGLAFYVFSLTSVGLHNNLHPKWRLVSSTGNGDVCSAMDTLVSLSSWFPGEFSGSRGKKRLNLPLSAVALTDYSAHT